MQYLMNCAEGMTWQNGEQWKELRKCSRDALGGWGVARESIESRVLLEIQKLLFEMSSREECGRPFDPGWLLHEAVTNVLCAIIFGCR